MGRANVDDHIAHFRARVGPRRCRGKRARAGIIVDPESRPPGHEHRRNDHGSLESGPWPPGWLARPRWRSGAPCARPTHRWWPGRRTAAPTALEVVDERSGAQRASTKPARIYTIVATSAKSSHRGFFSTPGEYHTYMSRAAAIFIVFALASTAPAAGAQILRDPGAVASEPTDPSSPVDISSRQTRSSSISSGSASRTCRRRTAGRPAKCDEQVGNVCYWYNDKGPLPPLEPASHPPAQGRADLGARHASRCTRPDDRWAVEQRVRYLAEAGRLDSAYAAAKGVQGRRLVV